MASKGTNCDMSMRHTHSSLLRGDRLGIPEHHIRILSYHCPWNQHITTPAVPSSSEYTSSRYKIVQLTIDRETSSGGTSGAQIRFSRISIRQKTLTLDSSSLWTVRSTKAGVFLLRRGEQMV